MSNEVNATKANEAPTRLADGTYQPVLTVSDLDRCGRRWMLGASIYNYESQCAPAVMFATEPALRKIYAGDEEGYRRSLLSTYRYYNATPQVSGLLLGAGLALEDKGHNDAIDAVQDLKIGLMGSLSGVGDTIFAILIPTIFGSIAAYMGQAGNPVGVLLWLAVAIAIFVWKLFDWRIGYKFGDKLFTTLAEKMSVFTESTSALGMMVVGALIPTVIKVSCGLTFTMGDVTLDVQTGILDQIMVGMLPVIATAIVYALVKRKVSINKIFLGILIISWVCAAFGILAA